MWDRFNAWPGWDRWYGWVVALAPFGGTVAFALLGPSVLGDVSFTPPEWDGAPRAQARRDALAGMAFAGAALALVAGAAWWVRPAPSTPGRTALAWGLRAALGAGLVGAAVSQFAPVYGGLVAYLTRPFDAARLTLLAGHVFLFGAAGFALGGAAGWASRQE